MVSKWLSNNESVKALSVSAVASKSESVMKRNGGGSERSVASA